MGEPLFALGASVVAAQERIPVFEAMQPELLGAGSTFTNAFADFDGDGDPDMFVGFDGKPNRLYRNDQGTFVDVAPGAGVVTGGTVEVEVQLLGELPQQFSVAKL